MGVDEGLQNVIQEHLLFKCIVFVWMISWTITEARSPHYENTPIQYTVICHSCKNDNC